MNKMIMYAVVSVLCVCTAWAAAVDATRLAAGKGNAAAQCQMGLFYMNGIGVDRDEDKAVEWLKKAAAQNHAQCSMILAYATPSFPIRSLLGL